MSERRACRALGQAPTDAALRGPVTGDDEQALTNDIVRLAPGLDVTVIVGTPQCFGVVAG